MGSCTVLHTEEMRRVVQCSANVTKSEVEGSLGRPILKVREHVGIRVCPNKSCTRVLTGLLWLSTWPSGGCL
jgi:hypothetical protein